MLLKIRKFKTMNFKLKRILEKCLIKAIFKSILKISSIHITLLLFIGLIICSIVVFKLHAYNESPYDRRKDDVYGHNTNFAAKHLNKTVASNLYNQIRITCCVIVRNSANIKFIKYTWGKRCQKILFAVTTDDTTDWDFIKIKSNLIELMQNIYAQHNESADWFFWTRDNTYNIMENLRYLLYPYHSVSSQQLYKGQYLYTNFGIVLSKEVFSHLVNLTLHNADYCRNCTRDLSACLQEMGFKSIELDHKQCLSIKLYSGHYCQSPYMVSIFVNSGLRMYMLEILLYNIHRYGVKEIHPAIPEKYITTTEIHGNES